MINEVRVGPAIAADQSITTLRAERTGSACTVFGHAPYSEAANRGNIMIASQAVGGVAPGTALSTTPSLCLWNPVGSGVNLNIIATSVGYVSGTLGAGSIVYAQVTSQATAPSSGTEITPVCTKIGAGKGSGRAFTGSTVSATPTLIQAVYDMGAFLASTAVPVAPVVHQVDGYISIQPGNCFVMHGVAAGGSTPLTMMSVTWEEVPQ
jgi:hypothetical protein